MTARSQAALSSAEEQIEALYKKLADTVPGLRCYTGLQAGQVTTNKRNRLLKESSSAVLLVKRCLSQKTVDDRELYCLDRNLAPHGDAAESDADMEVDRQALSEGIDVQQEEDFNSGSHLMDI
ncbi:hypothetical protein FN846DRAFT_903460 [Sphaerosporella brunnea]|uniref:Uncharacterized protein n=1 Tax=Sphaerosporella brunnea TaxID=1250544 RepID=A0A5J5F7W5_9PEZI|nr:hypothetical protein FN846DRAFT_903460 [Sphaerosporella brunnea]